jgi:hypothetical protein
MTTPRCGLWASADSDNDRIAVNAKAPASLAGAFCTQGGKLDIERISGISPS